MDAVACRRARPFRNGRFIAAMALAALLCAGFVGLGVWQVQRYRLKLAISQTMHARAGAAPVPAPGPAQWSRVASLQYLHVILRGSYLPGAQTLVRGTSSEGYGYWVLAPLRSTRGFVVMVNRGYIPDALPTQAAFAAIAPPTEPVVLTGLLRASEPGGGFLRRNQPLRNLWYSRDVAAIAAARGLPADEVAPYFVEADAIPDDARWPAAGLTVIHIYNHSLGYAVTWFALALGALLCAGIVIAYERRMGLAQGD
ncbi:MAG: SURF1 family protein [Proteobacteria bacterium]|nr:SURF1 family protein [Pseudomonadota bacterium]